ncbi:HAD-IA family hydrolase [Shewanella sp. SR44-3]|uniref:HAD-IA family hydrolase n=1 Tax=unclassified Shewanella TaxID=196818 RepID=UPI0015FA99BF|nr:HAD-IA family hydrolase [Shewanella sp. SR44-3]MBB1269450.1 HAD-IA family hydrolase [Shewanella sp. SR44-3]
MNSRQYDLVIFDWDGTLMDSIAKIVTSLQSTAQELRIPIPTEESVRDIIGLSMQQVLPILFAGHQVLFDDILVGYKKHYLALETVPSPLFYGVDVLLKQLAEAGVTLAIATGKGRSGLERVLGVTGIGHYFAASRTADDAKSKPHPQMLQSLLTELEIPAHRAVMIGDSVLDLTMANNAGIHCIGVSYGAHAEAKLREQSPKAVVHCASQLLAHL